MKTQVLVSDVIGWEWPLEQGKYHMIKSMPQRLQAKPEVVQQSTHGVLLFVVFFCLFFMIPNFFPQNWVIP